MTCEPKHVFVTVLVSLALYACSPTATSDSDVIDRLAESAPEAVESILASQADTLNITAASVTVVDSVDDQANTFLMGEASRTGLMQAASLSKPVAAAGILTLMEREDIDIDTDIRDRITSIDIRTLPGGDRPLSVRQLLSHTAGATQGGFPGYRRGTPLPDSVTIITDPPSHILSPVELSLPKGEFRYSGGGYQIAQLLAEDVSGQPFAILMDELLLEPLDMNASTFAQPIDPKVIAPITIVPANSGRRLSEGLFRPLKTDWLDYPEQAAAGLWTTSAEYARFVDAVLDATAGRPSAVSKSVADAMLSPVAETNFGEPGGHYGLGVALRMDDNGKLQSVSHSGLNAGYRALFEADLQNDRIVVSLSNAPGGAAFNTEAVRGLLRNDALTQP